MVELRFMLRYSDTKACALNCAILPLSTKNVQTHWIPVLGQLGFYFDGRLPSISVRSSPRMDECPGPIHSCLPFFSNNPELPAYLVLQAWMGTDHWLFSQGSRMAEKEFRISTQLPEGAPHSLYFPSLEVLKVPGSEILAFTLRQEILKYLMSCRSIEPSPKDPRKAVSPQCLGPQR